MRKNFFWYHLFRLLIVGTGLRFFYRKIRIEGKHKVPKDKPILIVPNHQNSFMDALLITSNLHRSLYFLTRAQAFSTKFMNWFLRSLQMLPVYRVRDGMRNIQKNEEIFQTCINKLTNKEAILVFAEANHDLKRRLRPFSKGFTRIAFDAEVQNNWNLDLHVVPVGVNYSDHRNSRNEVRVVFNDPIKVSDYQKAFEEDEREAANLLKNETSERLKPSIMHVTKLDQYPLVKVALDEMEPDRRKLANPDYMNKLVASLEKHFNEESLQAAEKVLETADKNDLSIRLLANVKTPKWKLILLSPIYFLVWLNNVIPYQPARKILKNKIKDPAFDASIKFVLGLVLFPSFYLIVSLIFLLAGIPGIWIAAYFVLSLLASTMFKRANKVLRTFKEKRKIEEFKEQNPGKYQSVKEQLEKISEFRKKVLSAE